MHLKLTHIGQIAAADISFGDLTVFVGPQASGKSIALQLLRLVIDAGHIQQEMQRYGLDWAGELSQFLDAYMGEGMHSIWRPEQSALSWKGASVDLASWAHRKRRTKDESVFLIPAQRVLTLRDGWPRPFTDYSPGDPFSVRHFSEKLRQLMEQELSGEAIFPQSRRLKRELRTLLERAVFGKFRLEVDRLRSQKRLVLGAESDPLPYMVWSAGQREFVPLLLGMYWLMPPTKVSRRAGIEWVILEELEMGLHPRAITVIILLVLELLWRGYRVCLSTHSPQVLEAVWAVEHLRSAGAAPEDLLAIFGADATPAMVKVAKSALEKSLKVYYFDAPAGQVRDISTLETGDEVTGGGGWGGLSEFSGRVNDAVAQAVANAERRAL